MTRPKATHKGTLFDGLADCYVLENGTRVLSRRGAVKALTNDAAGSTPLGRFIERLPSRFKHLATQSVLEFTRPGGGVAKGITTEQFSELLDAYVDSGLAGELHPQQATLARNARAIQAAAAKVGWIALIDEATGYQEIRKAGELAFIYRALLLESRGDWTPMFEAKLTDRVMRLHGDRYTGGAQPRYLASTWDKIYRLVLTDEVVAELKRRNPEPVFGTNHHQWLTPEAKEVLRRQLEIICVIADNSANKEDFWARMEHHYSGAPLQMTFGNRRAS